MAFPRREVAIVGVYQTEQAPRIDRSSISLQLEALKGALDDAGLTMADVDAIHPGQQREAPVKTGVPDPYMFWAEQLGKKPLGLIEFGHQGGVLPKMAMAISAGMCEVAVFLHGSANYRGRNPAKGEAPTKPPRVNEWDFGIWGLYMSPWYSLWAHRYMHEFGVTSEQLAEVAVTMRYHATLNPASVMGKRGPITVQDVVNSRMIADPLHLLDCCLDNDGGYAIVMTSAERAKDLKKKPVYILGGAESIYIDGYLNIPDPWFDQKGGAVRRATDRAFAMSGVTRDDIDVAGLYDCYTITLIRDLEEMGFCKIGEGADFVHEGHIRLGGKMPTNTHGGLLSCSHCGNPNGMHVIDVVKQLRGNEVEPVRQVKGAKIGITLGQGMSVHGAAGVVIMAAD